MVPCLCLCPQSLVVTPSLVDNFIKICGNGLLAKKGVVGCQGKQKPVKKVQTFLVVKRGRTGNSAHWNSKLHEFTNASHVHMSRRRVTSRHVGSRAQVTWIAPVVVVVSLSTGPNRIRSAGFTPGASRVASAHVSGRCVVECTQLRLTCARTQRLAHLSWGTVISIPSRLRFSFELFEAVQTSPSIFYLDCRYAKQIGPTSCICILRLPITDFFK